MKKRITEFEAIKQIAGEYERAGYDIVIQPAPELLPGPLRKFQPDLLARRRNESVLIEVKSRREVATENEMSALATLVGRLKGWRLEVQFIEPPRDREEPPPSLLLEGAGTRLNSATLLLSHGDPESALVVAWSAFEAVLRQLSWNADVPIVPWNGRRAAKQLVALGVLSRSEYELFMRGLEARNQVVHGGSAGRSVRPTVDSVISAIRRLAEKCRAKPASRAGKLRRTQ